VAVVPTGACPSVLFSVLTFFATTKAVSHKDIFDCLPSTTNQPTLKVLTVREAAEGPANDADIVLAGS